MEYSSPCRLLALAVLLVGLLASLGAQSASNGVRSLPAIRSRAEFDALARVTDAPYPLPHVLFVIDRRDKDRIYYVL